MSRAFPQLLRFMSSVTDITLFAKWVEAQIPKKENVEYWDGAEPDLNKTYALNAINFGFDANSSTKPFPMATVVLELAGEMDKDGFELCWNQLIISSQTP